MHLALQIALGILIGVGAILVLPVALILLFYVLILVFILAVWIITIPIAIVREVYRTLVKVSDVKAEERAVKRLYKEVMELKNESK